MSEVVSSDLCVQTVVSICGERQHESPVETQGDVYDDIMTQSSLYEERWWNKYFINLLDCFIRDIIKKNSDKKKKKKD